jgi:hypothetical protein
VAFSGQCYISHAHTGRSANRGECSQACRLPYTLEDGQGRVVAFDKHLLSMKDNDQSANLRALADAGIRSFKIEGRLKDMAYVKNATAHYRQLLDRIIEDAPEHYARASSGRCTFSFTPRPEKSFNRGATDYFVNGRQADIGAFDAPGFAGEASGTVTKLGPDWFELDSNEEFANGDGVSFLGRGRKITGLRINVAERRGRHWRLYPNAMPDDAESLKARHGNPPQPRPGLRAPAGKGLRRAPHRADAGSRRNRRRLPPHGPRRRRHQRQRHGGPCQGGSEESAARLSAPWPRAWASWAPPTSAPAR